MTDGFDPRTTLWRVDLADARLEGVRCAERYVDRRRKVCGVSIAPLRRAPDLNAEQVDQLVFGEAFDVLEQRGGWAWGQAARDGYVGWVRETALPGPAARPTHRVTAVTTWALAAPDVKARALNMLPLNALAAVAAVEGRFARVSGAGWAPVSALAPVGAGFATEMAAVAERFERAPYLWSGRTAHGIDCSGLVQQALYACGRACPRDSDQQEAALGRPLKGREKPRRGDLAFWDRHVGVMLDGANLLHANAFHMAVAREPLADAVARHDHPVRLRRL